MRKIIILSLLLISFVPIPKVTGVTFFVLLGQSNMVGHSTIPPVQQASNFAFNWQDGGWEVALAPLFDGGEYSLANQFLISLVSVGMRNIGVIPCAVDSTGSWHWTIETELYNDCINKIKAAEYAGNTIGGILVSQGEANTSSQLLADRWLNDWTEISNSFVDVPIVFAQLGYDPNTVINTHWTYLHDLQPMIVTKPNIRVIRTDDLGKKADNIHFTTTSNIIIGQRFASAWCSITNCQGATWKKRP